MTVILPANAKNAKKKERTAAPVRTPRSVEAEYRRSLQKLGQSLTQSTSLIGRAVNQGRSRAEVLALMQQEIAVARARYDRAAQELPASMTQSLSAKGKEQVENTIKRSMGVDFASIVDSPKIAEELAMARIRNAQLIESIPSQHFGSVAQAVADNFDGTLEGSLTERLTELNGGQRNRAKLIARDQTAKLSSSLAEARFQEAGIESYLWRNSQDQRVVGNPGGLYPKGSDRHRDHWSREGKEYRWDAPPPDGHPGKPIQCRCRAEPVVRLDTLKAEYV